MPGKKNTNINGIARRWLLTSLGVILVILVVLILVLSMTVRGSIYGNIESILRGRSVELTNAVSYTHLDVYKRQPGFCSSCF